MSLFAGDLLAPSLFLPELFLRDADTLVLLSLGTDSADPGVAWKERAVYQGAPKKSIVTWRKASIRRRPR